MDPSNKQKPEIVPLRVLLQSACRLTQAIGELILAEFVGCAVVGFVLLSFIVAVVIAIR